jgi:hypothetical protein
VAGPFLPPIVESTSAWKTGKLENWKLETGSLENWKLETENSKLVADTC